MKLNKDLISPRLIRMVTSTNWSLHDLILVDCKGLSSRSSYATHVHITSP